MHKKNLIRDFLVYTITSIQRLLFKGQFRSFLKDMHAFWLWRKFRVSSKSTLDFRTPWLSFDAIEFLKNWLKKDMVVFEYGSGGSSLFISNRVKTIYSIEHDEQWFENVQSVIRKEEIKNIEYNLYTPEAKSVEPTIDCSNPHSYLSCMGEFKNLNFEKYVRSIDEFPDNHFDLVIVDGRARPSCILHAKQKVKTGGILLVDNADRIYYLRSFPELRENVHWAETVFIGHFPFCSASILDTTILFTKTGNSLI